MTAYLLICKRCYRRWPPLTSEKWKLIELCPTCRRGMKPLSRLVGGRTREESERKDQGGK